MTKPAPDLVALDRGTHRAGDDEAHLGTRVGRVLGSSSDLGMDDDHGAAGGAGAAQDGGEIGRAAQAGSGREHRVRPRACRDPWSAGRPGSHGRRGYACADGSRGSWPDGGCSVGTCACSLEGSRLVAVRACGVGTKVPEDVGDEAQRCRPEWVAEALSSTRTPYGTGASAHRSNDGPGMLAAGCGQRVAVAPTASLVSRGSPHEAPPDTPPFDSRLRTVTTVTACHHSSGRTWGGIKGQNRTTYVHRLWMNVWIAARSAAGRSTRCDPGRDPA